jgi:gas vesicle protein
MADFRFGDYEFSRRRRNVTSAFGFLAIGLGLGALVALLMTPKTGRQIRRDVRRRYEDARDAMGQWSERAGGLWEKGEEWKRAKSGPTPPGARRSP